MGAFIDQVRAGKIQRPDQKGFTIAQWNRSFTRKSPPDVADERLHRVGLWFHDYFERVRSDVAALDHGELTVAEQVRCLVGALNYHLRGLQEMWFGAGLSKPAPIHTGQLSMLTAAVDGLRFPLSATLGDKQRRPRRIHDDVTVLRDVHRQLVLGNIYDRLEELFTLCVWEGFHLRESEGRQLLVPGDEAERGSFAIGAFRRDMLVVDSAMLLMREWSNYSLRLRVELWTSTPAIAEEVDAPGVPHLIVQERKVDTKSYPPDLGQRLQAEELYHIQLKHTPLPKLSNISIHTLLDAWSVLYPLADIATRRAGEAEPTDSLTRIQDFAPLFDERELVGALAAALSIDLRMAAIALEVFIFEGKVRAALDLWNAPFVRVAPNKLTVVVEALRSPNLLRSLEKWAVYGGLDLTARGVPFENHVRRRLLEGCRLANVQVHPTSAWIAGAVRAEREQIDLVVRIGSTVLLGEVKCSITPTAPMEFHNYNKVLDSAADQILRKSAFVKRHWSELVAVTGWEIPETSRVIEVIVTNQPYGAGRTVRGVPVIDQLILNRYFDEGRLQQWVRLEPEAILSADKETIFYSSLEEAEENLLGYLMDPPQTSEVRRFLKPRISPFPTITDVPVGTLDMEVDLPLVYPLSAKPETGWRLSVHRGV